MSLDEWNERDKMTKESTSKFIDWVGSLLLTKKLTEDINYIVSAKATGLFVNVIWNNHLQNPSSQEFKDTAATFEQKVATALTHLIGFKYARVVQFAMDEQTLESRSHVATQEDFEKTPIGTYVRFVLIFEKSMPRGYAEDIVTDYESLLEELDTMLAQRPYLTVLPGTFLKTIDADYAEKNGCQELSCMNDGICVDLANDFVCRCKMEFYGKKCQHMKYHTPEPLEVPVIAVTSNQARLKWIRQGFDSFFCFHKFRQFRIFF